MSWLPLLIMNGILLAITLVLALATRLLVTYGTCRIKVTDGDDAQEFKVQGRSCRPKKFSRAALRNWKAFTWGAR